MNEVLSFFQQSFPGHIILSFEKIPQSGSNRVYYNIRTEKGLFIATHSNHIQENETFIYFSNHFSQHQLPVPKVLAISSDKSIYIQTNVGQKSLLQVLEQQGETEAVFTLFKKSLKSLAAMQVVGGKDLDYNKCLTSKAFGKEAIMSDLLYFKYYFLDTLQIPYNKQQLLQDFETLCQHLHQASQQYFLFRDFQSRNILINDQNEIGFIDFQGGMQGALQYDVASLLWQAKANLSKQWKDNLLQYYMDCAEALLPQSLDKQIFIKQYNGFVLIRLLQVLGAYGFRGLFERKAHFLTSIPLGLNNLSQFLNNYTVGIEANELERLLHIISSQEIIQRFTPVKATEQTALSISINSFSYKKGIPTDSSENGGGFVFDMRGILNPGRQEAYKRLSGQDKPVQDFLEQQTRMPKMLNSIWDIIDLTIEDYLSRNFHHLQINFGCTGGQHRSVYAAEQTARHLRNKYNLKVSIQHCNRENWVR